MYLLWSALVLLAAILRLAGLAAAPLSSAEAGEALAAHLAARGAGAQNAVSLPVGAYSPLLFHLNTLLFILFDGGDWLARLVPALAGAGLVMTPLLVRRYLGQWGALGMGLLLAISPTLLFSSRTLEGTMPAALGTMLLVGCTARYLDTGQLKFVTLGGLGLAAALTAGPGSWGLLIGLLLALGGALWVWREQAEWAWPAARPAMRRGIAALALGVLALGSGLGANPTGLLAVGKQFAAFLARFSSPAETLSASPHLLLAAYEPLILLAGLIGIVLVVIKRHALGMLLAFWAAASWIMIALMPSRQPADLVWVLLPLAALGGLTVEGLAQTFSAHGSWLNEGLHLPISLVLWAHCGLTLARYARNGQRADLILAGLTLLLQVLLTAAFGFAVSAPETEEEQPAQAARRGLAAALRAGGLSLGLILLVVTAGTGCRLAYLHPADPRELLVREPTAVEVRTLVEVAEQVSALNKSAGERLPITFLGDVDPALGWALRRFDLQVTEQVEEQPLVIAPTHIAPPPGYFGETFPLRRTWVPMWGGNETTRWWLYRETTAPSITSDQVALWVREDLGSAQ